MQQTFTRKKSAGGTQDKATRPILAFLKPLGDSTRAKDKRGDPAAAAEAPAPSALQQANQRLALAASSKPASKEPSLFDFADSSGDESLPLRQPAVRPKLRPLHPLRQRTAAAAAVAAPPKPTSSKAAAPKAQTFYSGVFSDTGIPSDTDGEPAAAARAVAEAVAGAAAQAGGKLHKRQRQVATASDTTSNASEEQPGQLVDGPAEQDSSSEEEESEGEKRPVAGSTASASDWAPESADSEAESEDSDLAEEDPARNLRKGHAPKAAATNACCKDGQGSNGGIAAGGRIALSQLGSLWAGPASKRERELDQEEADVEAAGVRVGEPAEEVGQLVQAGGGRKQAGGGRKARKAHSSSLPVVLPKALAKAGGVAEACHLLCELEPPKDLEGQPLAGMAHTTSLEGDSGPVGRVLAPPVGRFQLDLKGILYETEAVPLPCTLALVHSKNAGSELVVEQIFSSLLRCKPGQDFMRENERALREMEAYDSDRYRGDSEGEGGSGKPTKGGRGGNAGRTKPAGGRGKGGGAAKKAAASRKRVAPKPKKLGSGGAGGGRKPAAKQAPKQARVSKAKAEASSESDWDSNFE